MRCTIVGAGIGGITTALSLLREGAEVVLLEQSRELREVGAGIQLSSNAMKVLSVLGVESGLAKCGVQAEAIQFIDFDNGDVLLQTPLGRQSAERYGAKFYQVHRADLLDVLSNALPPRVLRMNSRCVSYEQDGDGVTVMLASGEIIRSDVLIGADGIHSSIRRQICGAEDPKFADVLMWRALVPRERLRDLSLRPHLHVWMGVGRSSVAYWVRRGALVNFVGMVPATEVHRESWEVSGDLHDLRRSFKGCEPNLRAIIDRIDSAFITGLYYRDPLPRWSDGRVVLTGDAAHAMAPYLAQGACQAIEDAWTLAKCLTRNRDVTEGLIEFEKRRRPRATKVQAVARSMVKAMHEEDLAQIRARNGRWKGVARIDPLSETVWGWLYDHDPLKAVDQPLDQVRGLGGAFEYKRMLRPESQRAYDLWRSAFKPEDVARGVPGLRVAYERFFADHLVDPDGAEIEKIEGGGISGFWVTPRGAIEDRFLIYFHGGGYVLGSASNAVGMTNRLATAARARGFVFDYRLAPEHPHPAALEDALRCCRWLWAQGIPASRTLFSGEGAGAGLAIATALASKAEGEPLPAGVIALSPFVDLTVTGPTIREFAGHDAAADREILVMFASCYFQDKDPLHPYVSPLTGDFTGFPPLLIEASDSETLLSDATRLAKLAGDCGVDVLFSKHSDTVHAFALFPFLPETQTVMQHVRAFADARVGIPAKRRAVTYVSSFQ
jgi:salicylate hydroxylase